MKKITILLVASLLCCTLETYALNVVPTRQEITKKPGRSQKGAYTVTNDTSEEQVVTVSTKDWFIAGENKQFTCDTWLKAYPQQFVLKPGESKRVKFKAKIPREAKGALFAMISLASKSTRVEMLSVVISVPVFVIIKGTEKYAGALGMVKFAKDDTNLQASVEVSNNGNVHLRPKGTLVLKSQGNGDVEIALPETRPVYPGTSRTSIGNVPLDTVAEGEYAAYVSIMSGTLQLHTTAQVRINGDKTISINQ